MPDSYSVYNIILDGHGKSVGDFAKTNMKKWEKQVNSLRSDIKELGVVNVNAIKE